MKRMNKTLVIGLLCTACLAGNGVLAAAPGNAAQIPAWLDDGISEWNKANAANQIQFVDIKDSFVWYAMAGTPNLSAKDVRGKIYGIAYKSNYANMQDEEIVTTGRPPVKSGPATAKKCWSRSFLRDIQQKSDTTVQRMLTSMVCEDAPNWSIGFRVAQ
jgi:hypothetical protein